MSAYGPPGSYDPLARPAEPPAKGNVIAHPRSLSAGIPPDLPAEQRAQATMAESRAPAMRAMRTWWWCEDEAAVYEALHVFATSPRATCKRAGHLGPLVSRR